MRRPRDRFGRPLPAGRPDQLGFDPATIPADRGGRVDLARRLFDSQRFFAAHEVLEELWGDEPDPSRRRLWKGWLQLAVACCHIQRGNPKGALALLERARSQTTGASDDGDVSVRTLASAIERQRSHLLASAGDDGNLAFVTAP